jgi:phenylalanyl-tRNA synthetase beta chain
MRVPLRWLREYVDIDVPPDRLVELLSFSGSKVETVERPGADIGGVVVAEVLDVVDHPKADNLVLVDVKVREGATERVVCGARNFSVGDRVPLATVGAHLPGLAIQERAIRGEVSRGMLCSGAELGISKDHSGILVLPSDSPLGEDVVSVLSLDDTILELEITPNRGDCMGMIGIAREVAALLGNELKLPDADVRAEQDVRSPVSVDIEDPHGCPRYLARYIESVRLGSSPAWMSARLLGAGVRPISNVVDATNYVLLETGHPLHAFDAARVHKHQIVVRRAKSGEHLRTLDGVDRAMHKGDLLIADRKGALAIAGVMGGESSEVSEGTEALILESAYFDPASISRTTRRHLLLSEASARFERGADPEAVAFAARRATKLITEIAGGRAAPEETDVYPNPIGRRKVSLRPARTNRLLGFGIGTDEQARHLRSVGFEVSSTNGVLEAVAPSFRGDVEREVDLIEEVARLAGFDRLPATLPPGVSGALDRDQLAERTLRRVFAGFGLTEAWTSSFISAADLDALGLAADHPARKLVGLANPMSAEENAMRTTLLPGLLRSAARNVAHHAAGVALFEVARVFEPVGETLPREALVLGGVATGDRWPRSWNRAPMTWDFFAAKGVIEAGLASLGVQRPVVAPVSGMPFHPTRAGQVALGDVRLGAVGELHPQVCERFGVTEGTVAFELALAPVFAALPERVRTEELPKFPAVYLDLALVVDESVPARQVEDVIRGAGGPELVSVTLFDLYRGDQVPRGKKSLAYALELRSAERTLTDDDGGRTRDRILAALRERTGAELRT